VALIRASEHIGFVPRLIRVYREKRAKVPVLEYPVYDLATNEHVGQLRPMHRRMPRWAAAQIAWRQARNAEGVGTQE
jgi:hypothetical protein